MALLAGIGLALMGLSFPGRYLARLLGPLAFVVGLGIVTWAIFKRAWIAEIILGALLAALWAWETNRTKKDALTFEGVRMSPTLALTSNSGAVVGHGLYCHAIVTCGTKLEQVKGEAIRLEKQEASGDFVTVDYFKAPQELRWDKVYVDHEDYRTETVYPDVPGRLNIVNTESHDDPVTHLCVRRHGPGMGVTKLPPGDYRLTVRVSAPGAAHADARFLIHAAEWDELRLEMVQ
jgi:hypothetical protein